MKTLIERLKILLHYLKWTVKRWTGPRTYVVQYAYTDKEGSMKYDAHLVRGIDFDVRNITAYLQRSVTGSNLVIMGITEVPCAIYNAPVIDKVEAFVAEMDKVADNFQPPKPKARIDDEEEEDDGTQDATSMLG